MARHRLIDLSHPIQSGMDGYPGLPKPRVEPLVSHAASRASYEGQAEFTITRVSMVGNTGTYLDSPWHRHPAAADLGALPLRSLADLDGLCLRGAVGGERTVKIDAAPTDLEGRAVLIRTGWDERWGRPEYWKPGPYLGLGAVNLLLSAGVALVGVDFWNVDDPSNPERPAHTRLLSAGIPIVEHLCGLDGLPRTSFRFTAAPPAISGAASFPVRAFAVVDDGAEGG